MKNVLLMAISILLLTGGVCAGEIKVGVNLPAVEVEKKGHLVPEFEIINDRMVFKSGSDISYRKWSSGELIGKIRTIYHIAARDGIDEINKLYIDALIATDLPEKMPDSPYKTLTILNTDDALWGTSGIASSRLKNSQRDFPYAYYVNDDSGLVKKAWGLKEKGSAVIVLDKDGTVLFFKDGKLTPEEIKSTVALIRNKLGI